MYQLIYSGQTIKQGDLPTLWQWLRDSQHPPLQFLKLIAPDGETVAAADWRNDYQTWRML